MLNQAVYYFNSDQITDVKKNTMVSLLGDIIKDPAGIQDRINSKEVTMQDFNVENLKSKPIDNAAKIILSDFFLSYLRDKVENVRKTADYAKLKMKIDSDQLRSQTEVIPEMENNFLMKYFRHSAENRQYFNSKVLFILQNLSYLQIMNVTWFLIQFNQKWIKEHYKENNVQFYNDEYIATRSLLRTSTNTELIFERLSQLKAAKLKFNPAIKTVSVYKNLKDKFQVTLLSYILQVWPEIEAGVENATDPAHQVQLSATIASICFRAILKFIIEKSFTSWWISNGRPVIGGVNFGLNGKLNLLIDKGYRSNWVSYLKLNKQKEMAFIMVHCSYLKTTPLYGNFIKWVDDHDDATISSKLQDYYENLLKELSSEEDTDEVVKSNLTRY